MGKSPHFVFETHKWGISPWFINHSHFELCRWFITFKYICQKVGLDEPPGCKQVGFTARIITWV